MEHSQQNSKNPFVGAEIEPVETLDTSTSNCYNLDNDNGIDSLVLKVMRGHSALIEGSLVARVPKRYQSVSQTADDVDNANLSNDARRAEIMYELVQKGEQFAQEKREEVLKMEAEEVLKMEAEVADEEEDEDDSTSDDDDGEQKEEEEEKDDDTAEELVEHELIQRGILYAKPGCTGPTVEMYDLALDALAISGNNSNSNSNAVSLAESLLDNLLERYEALSAARDADDNIIHEDFDITMYTPTQASFNAVLRCAANADNNVDNNDKTDRFKSNNERRRDEVLTAAFYTLDRMYRADCVFRNAASYAYVLTVLANGWIPASRSRGNIARGLFEKACEEGVVGENVLEALRGLAATTATTAAAAGGGVDFEKWVTSVEDGSILPQKWRRNVKRRRHPHGAGLY